MGWSVRGVLGGVGVLATLVGALTVWAPSLVAETEPLATAVASTSGLAPRDLFVFGSVAVGLSLLASALQSRDDRLVAGDPSASDRFERIVVDPPETVTAPEETLTASAFDAAVERAADGDEGAATAVRDRLRSLAVARRSRAERDGDGTGSDPAAATESAERAVATGAWTDDRTAAAFLSGPEGPVPSLGSRLRLWLDPEAERERRIRRAVEAIDGLAVREGTHTPGDRSETPEDRSSRNGQRGAEADGASTVGGDDR